jgi:hypothetical protein
VIEELARQCEKTGKDLIVSTGVGQHQMWAAQYIRWRHPRTFITSGSLFFSFSLVFSIFSFFWFFSFSAQ